MRKFLFFIILMPAIAAFGHDAYFIYKDPNKTVRFSDLGALWDKYHKESHDQWKQRLHEFEDVIEEVAPIQLPEETQQIIAGAEEFSQIDGKESVMPALAQDGNGKRQPSGLQKLIGFLLEQKAVFVFGGFAVLFYMFASLLGSLKPENKEFMDARDVLRQKKRKRKGGGYGYSRK